ncbi:hypothetical protein ASC80_04105 [Afipia sp. Root123D2]|uniref:transglutaminase domain-containing protein n=1 Tax=Afipia sp. Root123D2 TaxID=1736436 RepID=UPI0006F8B0AC|nr:hypothetical protein [Afipia sp. Root123D2]KQW22556.1 hypothetical protein ASC80_04105 [Afipia sp. Root123D2]
MIYFLIAGAVALAVVFFIYSGQHHRSTAILVNHANGHQVKRAVTALALLVAGFAGWKISDHRAHLRADRLLQAAALADAAEDRSDLKDIRLLSIALEPRLAKERDPLTVSLLLRNLIYTRVVFKEGHKPRVTGYKWDDLDDSYRKTLLDPTCSHYCGGLTIEYLAALKAFGIPARKIGIYPKVNDLPEVADSHASVGSLISGKWIALDPTFNISIKNTNGERIGWLDAGKLANKGMAVSFDADGFKQKQGRSLAAYLAKAGLTFRDLTQYLNTSPYWDGAVAMPATKYPADWDGILHYADGTAFDAVRTDSQAIYTLLAGDLSPDE